MTQNTHYALKTSDWGGRVTATIDGQIIGELDFAADGFVEAVSVKEPFRRKGIATAMLEHMPIEPSFAPPDSGNSPDGDAWIAAIQRRAQIDSSETA